MNDKKFLEDLAAKFKENDISPRDKLIWKVLIKYGIEVKVDHRGTKCNSLWKEDTQRNTYEISISNLERKKQYSFMYWDSIYNTSMGIKPNLSDIFFTLFDTEAMHLTLDEFANEYGYDTLDWRTEKIYNLEVKNGLKLKQIMPNACQTELLRIIFS